MAYYDDTTKTRRPGEITAEEAAELAELPVRAVRDRARGGWGRKPSFPAPCRQDPRGRGHWGRLWFRRSDVEAWLEAVRQNKDDGRWKRRRAERERDAELAELGGFGATVAEFDKIAEGRVGLPRQIRMAKQSAAEVRERKRAWRQRKDAERRRVEYGPDTEVIAPGSPFLP